MKRHLVVVLILTVGVLATTGIIVAGRTVDGFRHDVSTARKAATKARAGTQETRRVLLTRIDQLERALRKAGVPVPPPPRRRSSPGTFADNGAKPRNAADPSPSSPPRPSSSPRPSPSPSHRPSPSPSPKPSPKPSPHLVCAIVAGHEVCTP